MSDAAPDKRRYTELAINHTNHVFVQNGDVGMIEGRQQARFALDARNPAPHHEETPQAGL